MSSSGRRRVIARMLSLGALLVVLLGVTVTTAVTMALGISLSTGPLVFALLWSATFFGAELSVRAEST